jgi:hypothetical protein
MEDTFDSDFKNWVDGETEERPAPPITIKRKHVPIRKYDPDQPRDDNGQWTDGGGDSGGGGGDSGGGCGDEKSGATHSPDARREYIELRRDETYGGWVEHDLEPGTDNVLSTGNLDHEVIVFDRRGDGALTNVREGYEVFEDESGNFPSQGFDEDLGTYLQPGSQASVDRVNAQEMQMRREEVAAREALEAQEPKSAPIKRKAKSRQSDLDLAEEMGKAIAIAIREATAPLIKRIAALEASPFKFVGIWTQGTDYVARNVVSYGGSLWHCNESGTKDKPGTSAAFTLCCKRGKDGRDAKNG